MQRTRYIPAGAIRVTHKASDAVAYLYTSPRGRICAITYVGKQSKPYTHHNFRDEAARERHVRAVFERREQIAIQKAEAAAAKRAWVNPYKPGDLFQRVWGYDQTNVDWYEVVGVSGKMMTVRKISVSREYTGRDVGKCVPLPGEYTGDPMRVLAQNGRIKINHYAHASFVAPTMIAGVKTYAADSFSTYA